MKLVRFFTVFCALALCALLILSTSLFGQAKSQGDAIKLSYSIFLPANHGLAVSSGEWAKEIEKRTNNRVKVEMYYGGTLTPPDKVFDGVIRNISDIGLSCMAYTRGQFPLSEVVDLPLGYKNGVQATQVANSFYNKFKPKEYDDVQVMYFHAHGPGILHTKTPVRRLEDLKGKKIRCTGLAAKVMAALGGIPVSMPMGETYEALKRGIVDGSMSPVESLKSYKWGEVVKSTTESFGAAYTTGFFIVMNKDKWKKLPADVRKIIEDINKEWIARSGKAWDDSDKLGKEFVKKLGNRIISLDAKENERWRLAVKSLSDDYVKSMKEKGLPGDEALKYCLSQMK